MQKKLQIHICDSGRGMQPSELRDMFIPCSPNNTSIDFINRNLPGINLALSKKIIQLHHGELWATSEQEKGCSFHIEMPYGTMHIT